MNDLPPENRFVPSYLLYLMAAASERASAQFHADVRAQGLRVAEWRVLACLYDGDGAMITRLTEFAMVEQSRLTRIIDRMAERCLVERRADPDDKRRVLVYLTADGRAIADDLVARARAHEQELLGSLEDTDAARIKPVLMALLARLSGDQS